MKQRLCHYALPPLRAVVPRSLSKNNTSASLGYTYMGLQRRSGIVILKWKKPPDRQ